MNLFIKTCESLMLGSPVTEFKFDEERKWKFDYAWPDIKLTLEVEGGIYGRGKACPVCKRKAPGAHSSIQRLLSDMEKYNRAASLGWTVLRCTPDELMLNKTFQLIATTILNKTR